MDRARHGAHAVGEVQAGAVAVAVGQQRDRTREAREVRVAAQEFGRRQRRIAVALRHPALAARHRLAFALPARVFILHGVVVRPPRRLDLRDDRFARGKRLGRHAPPRLHSRQFVQAVLVVLQPAGRGLEDTVTRIAAAAAVAARVEHDAPWRRQFFEAREHVDEARLARGVQLEVGGADPQRAVGQHLEVVDARRVGVRQLRPEHFQAGLADRSIALLEVDLEPIGQPEAARLPLQAGHRRPR